MQEVAIYRPDIQALRGLAVLLVLIYHADIIPLPAGFLGVDIFFVISGFLITSLIAKPDFTLAEFYWRRAKRLLPAAYVTFFGTALASSLILTNAEMYEFKRQLVGALTFAGNMVLWQQSGYFANDAALKPLLHVWSLAIEEQYYLLLPALMIAVPKRYWQTGILTLCAASFTACLLMAQQHPSAAFYLLPTRLWELAIGSIGALVLRNAKIPTPVYWSALASLFLLPFFPFGSTHPGIDAGIICTATLIVILAKRSTLENTGLSRIGDISYSLYLVHWPIFALAANIWLGNVPMPARFTLLALSLILAFLLHRYVEAPIRRAEIMPSWRLAGATVATTAALVALPYASGRDKVDYTHIMRSNYGFSSTCNWEEDFSPSSACRNADEPEILIWGDSYAMHLVAGIASVADNGVVQATRSVCGPMLGLAPIMKNPDSAFNRNWAEKCLEFNDSIMAYLESAPSIKTVILSSPFIQYTDADRYTNIRESGAEVVPNVETALASLDATIRRLKSIGRKVLIISPPPVADFNVGKCLEREANGKILLQGCDISRQSYRDDRADTLSLLDRSVADVIHLEDVLCNDVLCQTKFGTTPIYRDEGHLTYLGSIEVARRLKAKGALRPL